MADQFDPHTRPPPGARSRSVFWWVSARSSRREYWIYIAVLFGLGFLLGHAPVGGLGLTIVLTFVQARRVHDFGRSGWWAVAALVAPVLVLPLYFVMGEDWTILVALLVELALIVWIGAAHGDAGDNRFGPPPPFTFRRVMFGR